MDWFELYLARLIKHQCPLEQESPFVNFAAKHIEPPMNILECGCGPGRSAAALASAGFYVLAIDTDRRLLNLAADLHCELVQAGFLAFANIDINNLAKFFRKKTFDACTHSGVLEHFSRTDRRNLLSIQLSISDRIIMSVPVDSKETRYYFRQFAPVERKLQTKEQWLTEFSSYCNCVDYTVALQRTENLLVVLEGAGHA